MRHLDHTRAVELGRLGAAVRWSRTPRLEGRQEDTRAARSKRLAQFLDEAQALAAERGVSLTTLELATAAQHLQDAHLARARLARKCQVPA